MRHLGRQQDGRLVLFQTFPQVMGIGLGDSAALTVLPRWNRRQFFFAPGQDSAITFLQGNYAPRKGNLFRKTP
jgi:hypothetical protein